MDGPFPKNTSEWLLLCGAFSKTSNSLLNKLENVCVLGKNYCQCNGFLSFSTGGKGVLKICNKFTGEPPCRSAYSIKVGKQFWHGWSPVTLLHIFRTSFLKNTCGRLLLTKARYFFTKTNTKISPIISMKFCRIHNL